MKKYVAGFMFSEDRENIALIVKNKPDWQKGLLNGIGGKIEESDFSLFYSGDKNKMTSKIAMCREFGEEAGVITKPKDWNLFASMSGGGNENADITNGKTQQYSDGWSVDFYRCFSDKVFDCKTQEDEEIKIMSVTDALCSMTIDNLKWLIHLALDKNPKLTTIQY